MPKLFGAIPVAGSIVIEIPKKMLKLKENKVIVVDSVTKGGNITGGKVKNIKMLPVSGNTTKVISQGSIRPSDKTSRAILTEKLTREVEKVEQKIREKKMQVKPKKIKI